MFPDGRDLVARVKRDPDAALSSLTEKYGQQLYDYCVTMVADPDVASNAVAGALLAATRRIADLPDPRDFDVWLLSLARAECLLLLQLAPDRLRRRPPSVAAVADESDDTAGSGPERSPHDGQPVDVALVRQGLATLSVGDREVLLLQRGCGFGADQISQIMGVTPANATHRLARAGDHLAEAVAAQVLLHDPPGSCDALDTLVGESAGADAMGLRRLISAHVADCPWCAERVVDVRPVYALAEAGPRVYRSDSDAVAGIRQRLADASPKSSGTESDPTSTASGIPQPGVAVAGGAASKSAGQPARKRRWWLPASALLLLAGGGLAFAIADRPAGVSDVAAQTATGGSLQPAVESSVRTLLPASPATASATHQTPDPDPSGAS